MDSRLVPAVKRVPDDPHICLPDCWAFVVDGSILDERPLQFSSAGKIEAEGAFLNNDVTLDVGFGFNGTTDWGLWTPSAGRTGRPSLVGRA